MTTVLIVGASIAGPALAHCLNRMGFSTTVVERAPAPRPGGQAVDLRGIAKDVLHRIDLDAEVRAACTETTGDTIVTRRNRPILTLSADMLDGDGMIAEIEILRGDLSDVLRKATEGRTEYRFGDQVTGLEQHPDGVDVRFAGGAHQRFDVVVGADGLHSSTRGLLFGPEAGTRHFLGQYLAFYTVPNHLKLDRRMVSYAEPGRAVGIRSIRENQDAMTYFGFRSDPLDIDHRDTAAQRAVLRERMSGMGWEVPRLLEHLDTAPDFYFDACSQIELARWSDGRVGLLGDAAFCPSPLSGQGTSLAVVGAYVLAGELAARPDDPKAAFAEYERRMRPFVEANQKIGRDNARMTNPPTRFGLFRQYAMMWGMVHVPGSGLIMKRLMRGINEIDLPNYPVPAG